MNSTQNQLSQQKEKEIRLDEEEEEEKPVIKPQLVKKPGA